VSEELDAVDALTIVRAATRKSLVDLMHGGSGFSIGQIVRIRPKGDTAAPDVNGRLHYCDPMRVSIDHEHEEVGVIAVHFPVLGYVVTPVDAPA